MKSIIVCLLVVMAPLSANAANWIPIGESNDGIVYVDKSSILKNGSKITFWDKFVFKPKKDVGNGFIDEQISDTTFDCATRQAQVDLVITSLNGNQVATYKKPYGPGMSRVVPDSPNAFLYEQICIKKMF